jgi:hypothetical protein
MKTAKKNGLAAAAVLGAVLMAGSAVAPAVAGDVSRGGQDSQGQHGSESKDGQGGQGETSKHVLLLSVDGLRQKDLDLYVKSHPPSALASMVNHGTSYAHACLEAGPQPNG